MSRPLLLLVTLLFVWAPLAAQPAYLVKDINQGVSPTSSYPDHFLTHGNLVFFNTTDYHAYPKELWRTDGTDAGTFRLGPGGHSKRVWNGKVWFLNKAEQADELWWTDGTVAGTQKLSLPAVVSNLRAAVLMPGPTHLYFFGATDTRSYLWRTDGTVAGTTQVSTTRLTTPFVREEDAPLWAVLGQAFYFTAGLAPDQPLMPPDGLELWRLDANGLAPVTNITTGYGYLFNFTIANNTLFFVRNEQSTLQLWRSDGTTNNTQAVRSSMQTIALDWNSRPQAIVGDGKVWFVGDDGTGKKLWRSDGTDAGTVAVASNIGGASATFNAWLLGRLPNGSLLFGGPSVGATSGSYWGVWVWNGTTSTFLANVREGNRDWEATIAGTYAVFGSGGELWRSDGTIGGTYRLDTIHGSDGYHHWRMSALGNQVFFGASSGMVGYELWKTDGTAANTMLLKDLLATTYGSEPAMLRALRGGIVFTASANRTDSNAGQRDLWWSDGTAAGTSVLTTNVGTLDEALRCGDRVFFVHRTQETLWQTGGTAATTSAVPVTGWWPRQLTCVDDVLYLLSNTNSSTSDVNLWRTDGTAPGTLLVKNIGAAPNFVMDLYGWKNNLYFARPSNGTAQLWRSDGTPAGTTLVTNLWTSGAGSFATNGTYLFFTTSQANALWRSDGTTEGTTSILTAPSVNIKGAFADRLVFQWSPTLYTSNGLCSTDGNSAPTCFDPVTTNGMRALNGRLYYNVPELRSSDGFTSREETAAGRFEELLAVAGGRLYGKNDSYDDDYGYNLRETDGMTVGTTILRNTPSEASGSGGRLFIAAGELYAYDLPVAATSLAPRSVSTAGGASVTITGRGFTAPATVRIGGVAATVTNVTPTAITFLAPPMQGGTHTIVLRLGDGRELTLDELLAYTCGTLTAAIAPVGGPFAANTPVALHGSGGTRCAWFPVDGLDNPSSCTPTATVATSTTYTLIVLNASGCESTNHPTVRIEIGLPAPANVRATRASASSINVTWNATSGAAQYEIARQAASGAPIVIGTVDTLSFTDTTASASTAYLYRVRAKNGSTLSAYSAPDLGTTFTFTDDPLVAMVTPIRAVHLTQLRSAIDGVRALAGLAPASWTGTIVAQQTAVSALHFQELRTTLANAMTQLGLTAPSFGATIAAGGLPRAIEVQEIRAAID